MMNLIDTHFHLDHYRNYFEIAKTITELEQYTICVTNSPGIFLSCKNLIPETKYLKFAIGFHPQETTLGGREIKDFMRLISSTNYVGEIGLDSILYVFDSITNLLSFSRNTQQKRNGISSRN